jgi:hypothetical protein
MRQLAMGKPKHTATKLSGLYGSDPFVLGNVLEEREPNEADETRMNLWQRISREAPEIARCRDLAIQGILQCQVAKTSYLKLLRSGSIQPEVLQMLVGMAVSVPTKGQSPKWLPSSGMTAKQITYLPKRINGLADRIERLNKHPLLRPDDWIKMRKISESQKKALGKWLIVLPYMLRCYAAFLGGHTRDMGQVFTNRYRIAPRTEVLRVLMRLAREKIGKPGHTDLSNVLIAVANVAGTTGRGLDPDSLKRLDAVWRKRGGKRATSA